jgi:ribosomal protein L24E
MACGQEHPALTVSELTRTWDIRRRFSMLAIVPLVGAVLGLGQAGAAADSPMMSSAPSPGYWLMNGNGSSYAFNAPNFGSPATYGNDTCVNQGGVASPLYACVGLSAVPSGAGYWMASGPTDLNPWTGALSYAGLADSFGYVGTYPNGSSCSGVDGLNAPIVGIAAIAHGFWLVGSDGGVYGMRGAPFYGSMGGTHLNEPMVGIAATPDGKGYWLVASDGGVFSFGNAAYDGSMGGHHLNRPIVGIAATPDGKGYWLVASDGGVFAFGDAGFYGSMGSKALNAPMVGIAPNPDGTGYWTVASDGGVFAFGDAPFLGSAAGQVLDVPIVGIASKG